MFKSRGHSKYTTRCLSHLACSSAKGGLCPVPSHRSTRWPKHIRWYEELGVVQFHPRGHRNWPFDKIGPLFGVEFGVNGGYISVWILGQFRWIVNFSAVHGTNPSKKHHVLKRVLPFTMKNRSALYMVSPLEIDDLGFWGIFISEHPWISLVKNILRRPRGASPLINLEDVCVCRTETTKSCSKPCVLNEWTMMDYFDSDFELFLCLKKNAWLDCI